MSIISHKENEAKIIKSLQNVELAHLCCNLPKCFPPSQHLFFVFIPEIKREEKNRNTQEYLHTDYINIFVVIVVLLFSFSFNCPECDKGMLRTIHL